MLTALPDQTPSAGDFKRRESAVLTHVEGRPIIVLFRPGVASALDSSEIAEPRDVDAGVSDALLGDQQIALDPAGKGRRDDTRAGCVSDVTSRAVSDPLEGRRLRPVTHDAQFWFAVAAFLPDVEIVARS